MERVLNHLILESQSLRKAVISLEYIIKLYHEYRKDTEGFKKFFEDKMEELKRQNKDRVSDNISVNKW